MNRKILQTVFFLTLFGGVILLTFFIFKQYISVLFISLVFAIMFEPMYTYINKKIKGRKGIASFITVSIVMVGILIPLSYIGVILFQETKVLSIKLLENNGSTSFLTQQLTALETRIHVVAPDVQIDLNPQTYIKGVTTWLTENLSTFFSEFARMALNIFIMIIALFFLLRDGKELRETVVKWSPLADNYDEGILKKMGIAINSVIKGDILIAITQGLLAGIGFVLFGVPLPVLWGSVATITAIIPAVGTGIVLFPAVGYLYFVGHAGAALGLLIWGILIVGLVDNYLRPTLLHKDVNIHPFIILLSVFGGLSFFGPIGFLAGPIILSFLFALIDVYPDVMQNGNSS